MNMKTGKTHAWQPFVLINRERPRFGLCGQLYPENITDLWNEVNCKKCLKKKKIWEEKTKIKKEESEGE